MRFIVYIYREIAVQMSNMAAVLPAAGCRSRCDKMFVQKNAGKIDLKVEIKNKTVPPASIFSQVK